jgi:hypothetical protein
MGTEVFGLRMGMSIDELDIADQLSVDSYLLSSVPKPHSVFSIYSVTVSDVYGLVSISALSNVINTPPDGSSLIQMYFNMRDKLERKYGAFEQVDELNESSIWNEDGDFMRSLECQDRDLFALWDSEALIGNPDAKTLSLVMLAARSNDEFDGYLSLTYRFLKFDQYHTEKSELEDENL